MLVSFGTYDSSCIQPNVADEDVHSSSSGGDTVMDEMIQDEIRPFKAHDLTILEEHCNL